MYASNCEKKWGEKMPKWVKGIVVGIILCVLGFSSFKACDILQMRREAKSSYSDLNSQYVQVVTPTEPDSGAASDNEEEDEGETAPKEIIRHVNVDFEALQSENPDFWAWLYLIDDHIINYPICQHDDNKYYLDHLFNGTKNVNGTIFLDYRNTKPRTLEEFDANSLIYGHRMTCETMFHALGDFRYQWYYDEHPYFYLELPEHEYRLDVFASYVTTSVSDAYTLYFNEEDGYIIDENGEQKKAYKYSESVPTFEQWYASIMEQNLIKTSVKVEKGDKIITFSTCDYTYDYNGRFVVHCKVVDVNS